MTREEIEKTALEHTWRGREFWKEAVEFALAMCERQREEDAKIADEFEPTEKQPYIDYASKAIREAK